MTDRIEDCLAVGADEEPDPVVRLLDTAIGRRRTEWRNERAGVDADGDWIAWSDGAEGRRQASNGRRSASRDSVPTLLPGGDSRRAAQLGPEKLGIGIVPCGDCRHGVAGCIRGWRPLRSGTDPGMHGADGNAKGHTQPK